MSDEHTGYTDECGDHGGVNRRDEPCGRPAGWGTDFDSGKCKNHRGTNADGSSHKNNQNASIHGLYADTNNYYQDLTEPHQRFVDNHYWGFLADAPFDNTNSKAGILFEIAVNHHKRLSADGELSDDGLLVTEEEIAPNGARTTSTREHSLNLAYDRLARTDIRRLKELDVLDSPDSRHADALEGGLSIEINHERVTSENEE